ncbi:MAG TPA: hypothetical protein VFZ77_05965 [Acidimicrobiales bacterium]
MADQRVEAAAPPTGPAVHPVHRWRDLTPRERRWAVAFGLALLAAPIAALARFLPDWAPAGDPALMGIRALDVGTVRTPLVGQPSTSHAYGLGTVHHPGPLHLYLMALPVRVMGGAAGMLAVSVAVTGASLIVAAWAVFRQLGRAAGVVAAGALAAVAFTTGASSLVNPVSSSIAGYPLLPLAVLMWCVACGDVRLLPAAAAVASFTAQQHLSVLPTTAILAAGGLALAAPAWRRDGRWRELAARTELARWAAAAAAVALVLWAPVLIEEAVGDPGNLSEMVRFARNRHGDTLGPTSALWQVVHAIGLPPLLGRTDVTGVWLLSRPSVPAVASGIGVAAGLALLWLRWRDTDRRRAALVATTALVAVAGFVTGSSVPVGMEQWRIAFYHWTFVLAFLVALVGGLAAAGWLRRQVGAWRRAGRRARFAAAALAVAVVAAPNLANLALDRYTNTQVAAHSTVPRGLVENIADAVTAADRRLGGHTLLLMRNEPLFAAITEAVAFELTERGVGIVHPAHARGFVHPDRLVRPDRLDAALVLVYDHDTPGGAPDGGVLVADVDIDGRRVDRGRAGLPAAEASSPAPGGGTRLRIYLLDRDEALATAQPSELGR